MSAEKIEAEKQKVEAMMKLMENPAVNVAMTFAEPFPIGAAVSLLSAVVLRKRGQSTL